MPGIFWLFTCAGYCFWAAKGRRGSVVQGILHGFFLGMLCFGVLPSAMETPFFYGTAACSVCGMAAGTWMERKMGKNFPFMAAFLFLALTMMWMRDSRLAFPLFTGFLGGAGLYAACCGILPEGVIAGAAFGPAIGGGAGFLFSTIIFSLMGIF